MIYRVPNEESMNENGRIEFLKQCRNLAIAWGNRMPMVAMEDAGELIQAISRWDRYKHSKHISQREEEKQYLINEIGGMYITLMALQIYYEEFISVGEIDESIAKMIKELRENLTEDVLSANGFTQYMKAKFNKEYD